MDKNKYYKDFEIIELKRGYNSMKKELADHYAPKWMVCLFNQVWREFQKGNFSYDGATFVDERFEYTIFEVASFIHDYFNHTGYVGKNVDKLFIVIMEELKYPQKQIKKRKFLMRFTFINIIIHIFVGNYFGDINLKDYIKNP